MPSSTIQWFPGHMAKTRRLMQECLGQVDIILEVLDARIPYSSRNPEIKKLLGQKPILTLLNKSDMADPACNILWRDYIRRSGGMCQIVDCVSDAVQKNLPDIISDILKEKLERNESRGMAGKHLRAMIVGIPNVGKSSLINRLAGNAKAKVENRPGVTVNKQWIQTPYGIDLLDMPGVLWPKFDDPVVGENLAITGAIRDRILDIETVAMILCGRLRTRYPTLFCARYRLEEAEISALDEYDLLQLVGRRRGFLQAGGSVNERRTAEAILDDFRSAQIGRLTLETPPAPKEK